jgi:hypothetical protein
MADTAAPAASKVSTTDTPAPEAKQQQVVRQRPDEQTFKEGLTKYEKEHYLAQEKFVSNSQWLFFLIHSHLCTLWQRK